MEMKGRKWKVLLWTIIIVASVIRMVVPLIAFTRAMDTGIFFTPDTWSYLFSAQSLISFGTFASSGSPEFIRTPGYSLFLIPGVASGHVVWVTVMFQIILSSFTVYLVYATSLLIFERCQTALISASLYAFEPLSVLYASQLMTETLFTFFIVLFLFFLLRFVTQSGPLNITISALALGGAIYVRPIAYYLPAIVTLILFVRALLAKKARYKLFAFAAVFFLVAAGMTLGWQIRNWKQAGYWGISAIREINLYFYEAAAVLAHQRGVTVVEQQTEMGLLNWEHYFDRHPEQRTWSRSKILEYMGSEALNVIRNHPFTYSQLVLKGSFSTVLGPGLSSYLGLFKFDSDYAGWARGVVNNVLHFEIPRHSTKVPWPILCANLALAALLAMYWSLAALALASKRCATKDNFVISLILIAIVAYFLVTPLTVGHSRFRHPIMPILCVLGGCGFSVLVRRRNPRSPV